MLTFSVGWCSCVWPVQSRLAVLPTVSDVTKLTTSTPIWSKLVRQTWHFINFWFLWLKNDIFENLEFFTTANYYNCRKLGFGTGNRFRWVRETSPKVIFRESGLSMCISGNVGSVGNTMRLDVMSSDAVAWKTEKASSIVHFFVSVVNCEFFFLFWSILFLLIPWRAMLDVSKQYLYPGVKLNSASLADAKFDQAYSLTQSFDQHFNEHRSPTRATPI